MRVTLRQQVTGILRASITHGFKNPPVRMFLLAAPFSFGIGIWVFYAFQPYLLELFGDPDATYLAGIAAAVFALAQMVGGSTVGLVRRWFRSRTTVLLGGDRHRLGSPGWRWPRRASRHTDRILGGDRSPDPHRTVVGIGRADAAGLPQRRIPSEQRATVLSFVSLTGSAGGVVSQPAPGARRRHLLLGHRVPGGGRPLCGSVAVHPQGEGMDLDADHTVVPVGEADQPRSADLLAMMTGMSETDTTASKPHGQGDRSGRRSLACRLAIVGSHAWRSG